jgi:hypothetical protein
MHHVLLDDQSLLVEIFYDKIMVDTVDMDDNRLDGWLAFNENT